MTCNFESKFFLLFLNKTYGLYAVKHNMKSYPLVKQEDTVDSKELSDLPIVLYIARSREERRSSTSLLDNCKAILSTKTISFLTKLTDFHQTF